MEFPGYLKSPPIDGRIVPAACDDTIAGIVPLPNTGGGMSPAKSIGGLGSMEACSESKCILYKGMLVVVLIGGMDWGNSGTYWGCGCCKMLGVWLAC